MPKFGPTITPGGAAGNAHVQSIAVTVQVIGPLPPGTYSCEGDQPFAILQGTAAALGIPGAPVISVADLRRLGTPVPANVEALYPVDGPNEDQFQKDHYVAWVAQSGAGVSFRNNDRSEPKVS